MKLFIIGGRANVGKNTLAKFIKEYYDKKNEKSIITEYSKYIKLLTKEMIGKDYDKNKERKLLQDLGEEYRKTIDPNVFIYRLKEDISILQKYFDNIIIADARLINEIELMRESYDNCYTIHLKGNDDKTLTIEEYNHITEREFDNYDNFDYELYNYDLNKLKEDIFNILDNIN